MLKEISSTRRGFLAGLGLGAAFVAAAPYIIKNSDILMPIHDRGIVNPYSSGLYIIRDAPYFLPTKNGGKFKYQITVPRNEFRKFQTCNTGDIEDIMGSNYKHSAWLLKGAEATRLITF